MEYTRFYILKKIGGFFFMGFSSDRGVVLV